MSDDRRKLNKHSTGTVPKVKYSVKCRNNTEQQHLSERKNLRNLPNNLSFDCQTFDWFPRRYESNVHRNSQLLNFESMDTSLEEHNQNGIYVNGTTTSSRTSSSNSRRNSCGTVPKCDNVTKYPNKKQIEDKLNQIREYLHITTSLMSSMKNAEDQKSDDTDEKNLLSMIDALRDSEVKLNSLLINYENENSECVGESTTEGKNDFDESNNREILRDTHSLSLQHLKQKGDMRLKDARMLQERLAYGNSSNTNRMENNRQEYDLAIAELEETTKRLNGDMKEDVNSLQQGAEEERINDEIEELQNQIRVMSTANEDRNKLIQILDKRDAELRSQHLELQSKLTELQTKKSQVDHLVAALQTPRADDDMGSHVKKIISMKELLGKLKDMLEMVENTEVIVQNTNQEEQAAACEMFNKAENFLNKDMDKGNSSNHSQIDNHMQLQYENRAISTINLDNRSKQTNKNSREMRGEDNDSKLGEKLVLQAELKAKKRELEEIMGKHKASTSNLNHDVGNDTKSEFSCSNSILDNASGIWAPLLPSQHNQPESSERYSSDDGTEDVNEFSGIPPNQQNQVIHPPSNTSLLNQGKFGADQNNSTDFLLAQSYERMSQPFFRSPEGNSRGAENNSNFSRGSSVSNLGQVGKQNVQKQLELIRSVCDSMLPQTAQNATNVHHLRNNLTPSPIYSELRSFASPNPHSRNALNTVNPAPESGWFPNQPNIPFADVTNYQNWLTTNTLQTQAFMLNSLNQCCQMLWLQQRELATLRGMVTALQQDRLPSPHYNNENQMPSPLNQNLNCSQVEPVQPPLVNQAIPPMDQGVPLNQCRPDNAKINHVATTIPNLNQQYNTPPVTVDPIFANQNNLRLMESPLNNINVMNNTDHTGGALHVTNENINQLQGHIWNGQALNNQVPPGNRANNYWDNFRSYSRQNLFSTKSNDGIQNTLMIDRTNNAIPRGAPFELNSGPKSNSQHVLATPQENAPQRSCVKPSRRYTNTNIAVVPPDVLNINQTVKNEGLPLPPILNVSRSTNGSNASSPVRSVYSNNTPRTPRRHSNVVTPNLDNLHNRRRNLSNDSVNSEINPKSKLFEELRENIYREVVSLISANEARPHFLIQLFRDLQLVSSDPLRLKTLQSIQVLISQSLRNSQNYISQDLPCNQENIAPSNDFSMQSTVWSPIPPNSVPRNATILEGLISKKGDSPLTQNTFHEIVPFLNDNERSILNQQLLATLKEKILESKSFKKVVKDTIFQKHFSNVLDDVLSFYQDKPVYKAKTTLLQSLRDLLNRELSFMNLIQSSGEAHSEDFVSSNMNPGQNLLELRCPFSVKSAPIETGTTVQIQNGDLAEADQSHIADEDVEEEGAVGGLLEGTVESNAVVGSTDNKEDAELSSSNETFPASTEAESQYQLGLDQVPTRLPTTVKSRSNTPNRARTPKYDDHGDPLN